MDVIRKKFENIVSEYDSKFEHYDKFKLNLIQKYTNIETKNK